MLIKSKFNGGIHPPDEKRMTRDRAIEKLRFPSKVVIPLLQHTGKNAKCLVKPGDIISKGQLIGQAEGIISSNIHSSISGKVLSLTRYMSPGYGRVECVNIESDGMDADIGTKISDEVVEKFTPNEIRQKVMDAGVVGLGGAAFPAHVKLSPPPNKPIDTVILNGAECEPYLTCDNRLMLEKTEEIMKGLELVVRAVGAKQAFVAIEDNKPEAIKEIHNVIISNFEFRNSKLIKLNTKYPQGGEKQLVKAVMNRTIPEGGLPLDVGCVVQNVGTAYSIYEAVYLDKPLIERVLTLSGPCIKNPGNYLVRVGAILSTVVDMAGGFIKEPEKVIIGGPMMGISQYTLDMPVTKSVSGVIFLPETMVAGEEENVCIRCGRCIEVCPMGLVPTTMMARVKKEQFKEAKELGVANCCDCGCCAYSCPAKIPLVDYFKYAKAKITK